jgi:hypothetical protein
MSPASPSNQKNVPMISLIQPETIRTAVELFRFQLNEQMVDGGRTILVSLAILRRLTSV